MPQSFVRDMSTETIHIEKKKNLTPKLRFKGFSQNWQLKALGELGSFIGGGTPSTSNAEYWNGKIPWISSSDLFEDDIHNINIHRHLSQIAVDESATKLIPSFSVLLISRVGVGKFAVNKIPLCTSQDFANFLPKEVDSYFVAYTLTSKKGLLINFSQGTSIKGFTVSDARAIKFYVPELPEQQKIAAFLSAVDEKIQQLTRKKELLEQYKKGVMQQLFTSSELGLEGLKDDRIGPAENNPSIQKSRKSRFRQDNGKPYPKWEKKRLEEISNKKSSNIAANSIEENNGPYKIYGASGLLKHVDFYNEAEPFISIVKDGAGVGRTLLCDAKSSVLGTLDIIKPIGKVNLYFLYSVLNNIDFTKYSTGSTIPHIYFKDYSKERIKIPCLEEQTKIASFLTALDAKIESVAAQMEGTKNFKKGLLQQMFV